MWVGFFIDDIVDPQVNIDEVWPDVDNFVPYSLVRQSCNSAPVYHVKFMIGSEGVKGYSFHNAVGDDDSYESFGSP